MPLEFVWLDQAQQTLFSLTSGRFCARRAAELLPMASCRVFSTEDRLLTRMRLKISAQNRRRVAHSRQTARMQHYPTRLKGGTPEAFALNGSWSSVLLPTVWSALKYADCSTPSSCPSFHVMFSVCVKDNVLFVLLLLPPLLLLLRLPSV